MPFFSLFSLPLVLLILSTQLYASTVPCDSSVNLTNLTNCNDTQPQGFKPDSINDMRSDATQTPTILPDISPTKEDLNDAESDSNDHLTMQMKKLMIEKKMMEMILEMDLQ